MAPPDLAHRLIGCHSTSRRDRLPERLLFGLLRGNARHHDPVLHLEPVR